MRISIARRTVLSAAVCLLFGVTPVAMPLGAAAAVLPQGHTLWTDRLSGPGKGFDFGQAVTVSPDGSRTFVAGWLSSADTSDRDYLTVAYDTGTGAILWSRRRVNSGVEQAAAIVADASTVYVTGQAVTVAYDAVTGSQRWVRPFAGPVPWAGDAGAEIAVRDGVVFVTGITEDGMQTVTYDAATGRQLWARRYEQETVPLHPEGLGLSPDGTMVAVTGENIALSEGMDYVTIVYDAATGRRVWVRIFDGQAGDMDVPGSLGMTEDLVVVTGESTDASGRDLATIAYDVQTGERRWVRRYDGPTHGSETLASLSMSPDLTTAFVVTRSASPLGGFDSETIAYAVADGATVWKARLNVGLPDYIYFPPAIQASPDGTRVIVTGRTADDDFLTVAFGADDGERLWARRFARWGMDAPSGVAVSPDGGTVVVTGTSWQNAGSDIATVAYRAR